MKHIILQQTEFLKRVTIHLTGGRYHYVDLGPMEFLKKEKNIRTTFLNLDDIFYMSPLMSSLREHVTLLFLYTSIILKLHSNMHCVYDK